MYNYLLYRIGQFIALSLPLKAAYWLAILISDLHYLFARSDREAVGENLKAIFPQKSKREINEIKIRMFRNFAKYLVDFFRFSRLDIGYIKKNIKIENRGYIDEALAKKKGVITITAHLGNWELGGVVISLLGYHFSAVAMPHKDKRVNKFFNSQRENRGINVIPLGNAVRQCFEVLKKNEVLALVGDRDFSEKGIVSDFFGKPTFLPEGPAAFALKTGAAIVPGFMVRNNDDTFTLRMEHPIEYTPIGDKDKDLNALIGCYKTIFEDYIKRYPDQWYMFRRFWIL
ncbi:MAG: lysophospholipid acyltransferase family protein [Candidatus Omnitrophota bacterium]